jgi:hypothetical protein
MPQTHKTEQPQSQQALRLKLKQEKLKELQQQPRQAPTDWEESDPQMKDLIKAFLSSSPEEQERLRNETVPMPILRSKYPEIDSKAPFKVPKFAMRS